MMAPEAISEAVFLSDMSSQVTGIYLPVDYGHLLIPGVNDGSYPGSRITRVPEP